MSLIALEAGTLNRFRVLVHSKDIRTLSVWSVRIGGGWSLGERGHEYSSRELRTQNLSFLEVSEVV